MNKVLITGACGYLGARLSKYLAETGYRVTALDSFDPYLYSQWTSLMEDVIIGDIRDENIISDLAEKQFDVVIHLISLDHHKSEDNPNFVSSINVMPIWNLLDKLTKNGLKKVKDVKKGELVYSINPKTLEIELNKVTKTYKYK